MTGLSVLAVRPTAEHTTSGWSHALRHCYLSDRAGFVQTYQTKANFVSINSC